MYSKRFKLISHPEDRRDFFEQNECVRKYLECVEAFSLNGTSRGNGRNYPARCSSRPLLRDNLLEGYHESFLIGAVGLSWDFQSYRDNFSEYLKRVVFIEVGIASQDKVQFCRVKSEIASRVEGFESQ